MNQYMIHPPSNETTALWLVDDQGARQVAEIPSKALPYATFTISYRDQMNIDLGNVNESAMLEDSR